MQILKSFFKAIGAVVRFINTYFKTFVLIIFALWLFTPTQSVNSTFANLQRIDLKGEIVDTSKVLEKIINAKNDTNIKGVLFVIDSPGGAFAPSMELALAINNLKKVKPVVVYALGTMASGSYLSGVGANKILANPASFIGSIGVLVQGLDVSELANKLGIKEQSLKAGEFKQIGTFTRTWSPEEKAYLQNLINESYELFTTFVAKQRKLDLKARKDWADAKVFLAQKAKDLGLIDGLSDYESAKKELQKLAGVSNAVWKEEDKIDKFLEHLSQGSVMFLNQILSVLLLAKPEIL